MLGELRVSEGFTVDCGRSERSPAKGLEISTIQPRKGQLSPAWRGAPIP